jgi:hypothetical protein
MVGPGESGFRETGRNRVSIRIAQLSILDTIHILKRPAAKVCRIGLADNSAFALAGRVYRSLGRARAERSQAHRLGRAFVEHPLPFTWTIRDADFKDGVTVLYSGDVTTYEAGVFFDIALRQFLCFTDSAYAVADEYGGF